MATYWFERAWIADEWQAGVRLTVADGRIAAGHNNNVKLVMKK